MSQRIALSNHIRGTLSEFGIVIPLGNHHIGYRIAQILEDGSNELNLDLRSLICSLYEQYEVHQQKIDEIEQAIRRWHQ